MFLILLMAWVLKISSHALQEEGTRPEIVRSLHEIVGNAMLGPVPGWVVLAAVALFYAGLGLATVHADKHSGELAHGEVHV